CLLARGGDDGPGGLEGRLQEPTLVLPLDVVHHAERLPEADHHQREIVDADGQEVEEDGVVEDEDGHGARFAPAPGRPGTSGPRSTRYRAMSRTVGSGSVMAAWRAA